jgi:hypothetical protein
MSKAVVVKRGDAGVIFEDVLDAGGLTNLDDVETLLFLLREVTTDALISKTAAVVDSNARTVKYVTQPGDLDMAGIYRQEWEATFTDEAPLTFPSRGYNYVYVDPDLNPPVAP